MASTAPPTSETIITSRQPRATTARPGIGPPAGCTRIASVALDVTDARRSVAFWRDTVGLSVLAQTGAGILMGVGDAVLVTLYPGAAGPVAPRHAGLYHLAIHVQDDAEFARSVARFAAAGWPHSATDHTYTKSIYVADPDGNGLEIALETPHRVAELQFAPDQIAILDRDGVVRSGVDPLDLGEVLSHLPGNADLETPMRAPCLVGHVHLHVADIDEALAFYVDGLGLERLMYAPGRGVADTTVNGWMPHLIAVNVWNGPGATPRPEGTAGLRAVHVEVPNAVDVEQTASRLSALGHAVEHGADGIRVQDPAGNVMVLCGANGTA